jgi:predicted phage tail component-like protein
MRGFKFNNKHIYKDLDFKIYMHTKSIQPPSKKKIKETVPFMNGSYDFSTVGTNGELTYEERAITIELGLVGNSKEELYSIYSKTLQWLVDSGPSQLIFDDIQEYYFLAEVEDVGSFEEIMEFGKLTVTFKTEPFKKGMDLEGSNLWDTFNFETDIMQTTTFNVTGSMTVTIVNPGRIITPQVIVSANMSCLLGTYTASFTTTKDKDYKFRLQPGENVIKITGTGSIEFRFRKEVL